MTETEKNWSRGSTGAQRYGRIPRIAAHNLGEMPQNLGAPKSLVFNIVSLGRDHFGTRPCQSPSHFGIRLCTFYAPTSPPPQKNDRAPFATLLLQQPRTLRLLNSLNSEDRGLKVRFSLAAIAFDRESAQMSEILSSQGKNAPSNPYPHYLVRLATSRKSETGRIRFRGVRFQTPNSVSFLGLAEVRGENSVSSSRPISCVPKRTHRVFPRTHRVCPKTQ